MKKGLTLIVLLMLYLNLTAQNIFDSSPEIWKWEQEGKSRNTKTLFFYDDYDVVFCKLDLHLERNTIDVDGNVTFSCVSRVPELGVYRCELIPELTVDSVFYNSNIASFSHEGDTVSVILSPEVTQNQLFTIRLFYHGTPVAGNYWAGISTKVSPIWGNEVTWTLSQPANAKQWWPCKQDLRDKIDSVTIFITTDSSNKVGSNGVLTGITPVGNGKVRYEWNSHYPIDYYLISASVADYQEYNTYARPQGTSDSILIQNYIYDAPGCLEHYQWDLDNTNDFLELFSRLFGTYPFGSEKYGHCQVELAGGMEHQTMGSLGDFNFHLICHELAHQWFGDYVTCRTWNDIWVNEGFATYCQYLTLQYIASQAYADTFMMGVHDYVMSFPGGSVYIPEVEVNDVARIFNGRLSYNKGAVILHALRGEIDNDTLFFGMLRQYVHDFGNGTATGLDVRSLAENLSGDDYEAFFEQWYFGEGYPAFTILWSQLGDSVYLNVLQQPSAPVTPFFRMHLEFRLVSSQGDTVVRLLLDKPDAQLVVYAGREVQQLEPDPHYWNLFQTKSITRIPYEKGSGILQLFPNPCSDEINYLFQSSGAEIPEAVICDSRGSKVSEVKLNTGWGKINTAAFSSGVYYIYSAGKSGFPPARLIKY